MHNASSPECWVCGHPESRLWLEQGGVATYRCPACGLVFSPSVSASTLNAEIYSHQLTHTHKSEQSLEHRKSRLRRHILRPLEFYRRTGKVLEVGFGRGEFLEVADTAGWQVQGIDVAPSDDSNNTHQKTTRGKVKGGQVTRISRRATLPMSQAATTSATSASVAPTFITPTLT